MHVKEKTEDRLVMVDTQLDKKLGIGAFSAFLLFLAWQFASGGDYLPALFPTAIVAAMLIYLWRSRMRSELIFDKTAGRVDLVVEDRNGTNRWDWDLSEVETAELSEIRRADETSGNGLKRPVLVLKDGTRTPLRPDHSAGGMSFEAVAAIQHFLGQEITDAPVGWLNPYEDD